MSILKDSSFGHIVRLVTKDRVFAHEDIAQQYADSLARLEQNKRDDGKHAEKSDSELENGTLDGAELEKPLTRSKDGTILVGWFSDGMMLNPRCSARI